MKQRSSFQLKSNNFH